MIEEILWEGEGAPTWLETPATEVPALKPPVDTRVQLLPLNELTWEHFERLCLRYVRTQSFVVRAQLYGVKGQKQHGIDLYVRLADPPRYEVYQCKRLASFTAADVKKAVDTFLTGKWHDKSKAFRIMTSHPIEDTKIGDAIEAAAKRLEALDITFEVIGQERLSEWLKDQPRLVDDFFSRAWVEEFCGLEGAKQLTRRMNAEKVAEYRVRLKKFYQMIFNRHDPGIPVPTRIGQEELQLRDRFVVPEVYGSLPAAAIAREVPKQSAGSETSSSKESGGVSTQVRESPSVGEIKVRVDVDRWLSQGKRSVILGGPGSGKSALLRTLAVELLSEEPVFRQSAVQWGTLLPVWIPFSFWTTFNTRLDSSVGLSECLATWFRRHEQGDIWPLVEAAIEDERLLLLVDGLDEWTDETAARTTSNLLQAFVQTKNLPAVLASRPHGFERVSVLGSEWQVGNLAAMSREQQTNLVVRWLAIDRLRKGSHHGTDLSHFEGDNEISRDAAEFIRKLAKSTDLLQLAEVPLTLLLLLYLHLQNYPLPSTRFEAYEYVADHFIRDHPLARRVAAALTSDQDSLTPKEIQNALAYLAYIVQTDFPGGIVSAEDVRLRLEDFLQQDAEYGLSLSRQEAREVFRSFTNLEEGSLGLLVSQGQANLSFFHRSLQEYLAAVHLARTPSSNQQAVIRERLADPRWREVIVGMVYLCRRDEDAGVLVDAIEKTDVDVIGGLAKEDLLSEIAFRESNLTPARSKTLAQRACTIIETSFIPSQRGRLLNHALSGLNSRKTRALVQERIRRWVFSRGLWGSGRIEGLRIWPATDHTWETLFRSLHDEDVAVMRTANDAIAHVFGGVNRYGEVLAEMALKSESPGQRAAAIEGLAKGWPSHSLIDEIVAQGCRSVSLEVKTASLLSKVRLGKQQDVDLTDLLELGKDRFHSGLEYEWRPEVANALAQGWPGNQELKRICLNSCNHHSYDSTLIDRETALSVVGRAFPQDDDVAAMIADQLKQEHSFSSVDSIWKQLPNNFRNHEGVVKALDEWVQKEGYHDALSLHYAALVGRTPLMKAALIKSLNEWTPFWATRSLLEGWGMADLEVAAALTERAARADAAEIGQYLPQILGDPETARARLLDLLKADESKRLDFVIQGISKLKPLENEGEIVDAALQRLKDPDTFSMDSFLGTLILTFPTDDRVKALARKSLKSPYPPMGAMVEAYASDEQFRVEFGEAITPLPVHLRYQIVSDLPLFSDKGFAIEVLEDWDTERNGEVKTQASIQYHTLLLPAVEQTATALEKLDRMLPCYGPDHEDRRQAAASGLIILHELHRIVGRIEVIGHEGQLINVPVTEGRRQNRVFLNLLGAQWPYVKKALNGDLSILTSRIGPGELWERLAIVATDHLSLTKEILEKAETDPGLRRSSQFLALLGRLEPRSENLVRACLAVIGDHDNNWHDWFDATEAAASILAEQFRGDPTIEPRLQSLGQPDRVSLGVIMALSLGWRHTQILTHLEFRRRNAEIGAAELYTKYARISSETLAGALEQDLVWAQHNGFQAYSIVRPLVARLKDDPRAIQAISERLFVSTNPSVKASFCKLLAISGSFTPERDSWSREELKRQSLPEIPEFGYDILTRSTRAVSLCLLESLGEATTSDGSSAADFTSD
jgi:energy-coupling factor transporter ATP-binding protein EcfA2